jgi:hypothetical protein
MAGLSGVGAGQLRELGYDGIINFPSAIFAANIALYLGACFFIVFCRENSLHMAENFRRTLPSALTTALAFLAAVVCMSRISPFIYFNF